MSPAPFPQANTLFGPPQGMTSAQVQSIGALVLPIKGGSLDGSHSVTVAWKPDPIDIERLRNGGLIYLHCIGGLLPPLLVHGTRSY